MASISQARDAIPATQRTATDAAAAIVGAPVKGNDMEEGCS